MKRILRQNRRVSGNSLPGSVYRYQLLANSIGEVDISNFENLDIASSDDEALIIDSNILDVVADLPPKNQWTEHLVEYTVIAFIDAANVNRFLNSTVMWVTLVHWQQNILDICFFQFLYTLVFFMW